MSELPSYRRSDLRDLLGGADRSSRAINEGEMLGDGTAGSVRSAVSSSFASSTALVTVMFSDLVGSTIGSAVRHGG